MSPKNKAAHNAYGRQYHMQTATLGLSGEASGVQHQPQRALCALLYVVQDHQQCVHVQNLKLKAGKRAEQHQMTQERRQTFQQKVCNAYRLAVPFVPCVECAALQHTTFYRLWPPQKDALTWLLFKSLFLLKADCQSLPVVCRRNESARLVRQKVPRTMWKRRND